MRLRHAMGAVAVVAGLAGTASAAMTPAVSAAQAHDLACVAMTMDAVSAIQAAPASDGHDPDRMAQALRRISYFIGRLTARDAKFDFTAALARFNANDRPRYSADHALLTRTFDGCVAEFGQSWTAFAIGASKTGQK